MNQQENRQSATPSRLAALGNDHANRRRLPVHLQRSYGVRHLKLLSRRWHTYRALVSAICVIERFRCDRNWKVTQHHVLAIVALCLLLCASAAGNDLYSYVIVAQTNRSYDGVVFTTLGNAPSIADDGTVAFVAPTKILAWNLPAGTAEFLCNVSNIFVQCLEYICVECVEYICVEYTYICLFYIFE